MVKWARFAFERVGLPPAFNRRNATYVSCVCRGWTYEALDGNYPEIRRPSSTAFLSIAWICPILKVPKDHEYCRQVMIVGILVYLSLLSVRVYMGGNSSVLPVKPCLFS